MLALSCFNERFEIRISHAPNIQFSKRVFFGLFSPRERQASENQEASSYEYFMESVVRETIQA